MNSITAEKRGQPVKIYVAQQQGDQLLIMKRERKEEILSYVDIPQGIGILSNYADFRSNLYLLEDTLENVMIPCLDSAQVQVFYCMHLDGAVSLQIRVAGDYYTLVSNPRYDGWSAKRVDRQKDIAYLTDALSVEFFLESMMGLKEDVEITEW